MGLYKMDGFYRKKGGAKELLAKEKKSFLGRSEHLLGGLGEETAKVLSYRLPLLPMGDREGPT